jgi:signal transduction histidine kinase
MATTTELAIRRATLLQRLDRLTADHASGELREVVAALRALAEDEPDEPDAPLALEAAVDDGVRAAGLRLAGALPAAARGEALTQARRAPLGELALLLPAWAEALVELVGGGGRAEAPRPAPSFHLLEQLARELEPPAEALEVAVEHLRQLDLELEADRAARSVLAAAESIRLMLNDLVDLASLGEGRLEATQLEFSVRDCVVAAVDALRPRADREGVELQIETDGRVPERLVGDPGRLRQVIHTLAGNAIAAGAGSVRVHVDEEDHGAAHELHVCVRAGQPPGDRARGEATRRDSGAWVWRGGMRGGFGLSVARQLVQHMGGRTWVGSGPDGRSEIHFTVALQRPEPGALAAMPERKARAPVVLLHAAGEPSDELAAQLQRIGHAVWRCVDLRGAAAQLAALAPDGPVALIAGTFGRRQGQGFVEQAAAVACGEAQRPAGLITRGGQRGDAERCRRLGLGAYLVQPCSDRDLADAIAALSALGLRARRRSSIVSSALVTRHFLRESRRTLCVLRRGARSLDGALAALGHRLLDAAPLQEVDLVLLDASEAGAQARSWLAAQASDLGGDRPPVLAVLAPEAAGFGLPADAPIDEIALAPVEAQTLAALLPKLRARRHDTSPEPSAQLDLGRVGAALGGDAALGRSAALALSRDEATLRAELVAGLRDTSLAAAGAAARSLGSALGQLGFRVAAGLAFELDTRCPRGDLRGALARSQELWPRLDEAMRATRAAVRTGARAPHAARQTG